MANHISDAEGGWNIFPGLDVGYELGRPVKIIASFNTSMRMPTFTDLYYSGPANVGNPGLKPEKSMTLEGGIKLMRKFIRGHFIVFYRQGKNMIDWVKQSSDELWQAQNLTEIKSLGTEIQVQFFPADKLGEKWPDNIKISYCYNNQEKENSGYISNYVLDNLKHKLITSANQSITKNIYVNLRGTFQDREGTFSRFENRTAAGEVSYNPFWLFDGKVVYSRKNFKLYVSANNIFNCEYFDLGNIVQPGRWIKTGVFYQLNFK
jgi:vitamin B12 transporter